MGGRCVSFLRDEKEVWWRSLDKRGGREEEQRSESSRKLRSFFTASRFYTVPPPKTHTRTKKVPDPSHLQLLIREVVNQQVNMRYAP
ncbi:hypothetical protein Tco_0888085 [Tanacetum coccineum]